MKFKYIEMKGVFIKLILEIKIKKEMVMKEK